MQRVENNFTEKKEALHVLYYCGKCNDSFRSDNKFVAKCKGCKKKLVRYFEELESKSYVLNTWHNENIRGDNNIIAKEPGASIIILSGLAFGFAILVLFYKAYHTNFHDDIDGQIISQLGDVLGGVVSPIWALAGVLLFYKALRTQVKSSETNQEILLTQVSLLNSQLTEYQESLEQTKKIVKANEVYNEGMNEQLRLLKQNLDMDKKTTLLNAYSQLARVYDDNPSIKDTLTDKANIILEEMENWKND